MSIVVWWVRRDLRLHDNLTLNEAMKAGTQVVPLFFIDPFFERSPYVGDKRRAFLWGALRDLDARLKKAGSRLIVRHGDPVVLLPKLIEKWGAEAVFAEEDYSPYARRRDAMVQKNVSLTLVRGVTYHHPNDVLKDDGDPYVVYTPYKKKWLARPLPRQSQLLAAPDKIETPSNIESDDIPVPKGQSDLFPAAEDEARRRLAAFADERIYQYEAARDFPASDGTSQLSPYLRFGLVSAREAIVTAVSAKTNAKTTEGREGAHTWLEELIWREFYLMILYHFPHVLRGSFRPVYDKIAWRNDKDAFEAWCQGQTGYPIVDAAMRQLKETGWMHNRARMIVASFLVKDLLINWRWGERWFMQQLIDGDPAANNGGWQWSAGTGTDAAPYFRIFNPTTQSERFDKEGVYIRRFVPELAKVEGKLIHEPSKLRPMEQKAADCIIGEDYPKPIVDHKAARQHTLDAYKAAKEEA